ncbi:MAG: enoyl-ACP reductase FabI [Acidimicrobiia bacterium]|nr:enoyl-ACP reductase FabI [Acidimicrobiia bacterium]
MGILEGKKIVVTGVLTEASIAFSVARVAQEQGAEVVLTSFGRPMRLTTKMATRLPVAADVLELDVTNPEHVPVLTAALDERWGRLDGIVHAIGFAPQSCLGGGFMTAPWEDVSTAVHVSAYSLRVLADLAVPLMEKAGGGSIVGLDFDNSTQAWPVYDWMGVAKAALEATSRYLARDLGARNIRCNLVAAGPIRTMAASSIPGFEEFEEAWQRRAPLGWDVRDPAPAAKAIVALLSDFFPATTGEIVHVDGGYHAVGA